jgi:hypothetical protein
MVNLLLGLWLEANKSGFLLRHRRARVQDLELDADSFNGNGSTFGRLPWRSAKLLDINGAVLSLGEEVVRPPFLGWLLR